eukprot:1145759-Pelagomonas_calceolata.AAC.1
MKRTSIYGGFRFEHRQGGQEAFMDGVQVLPFRNIGIGRCQSGIRPPVLAWSLWPSAYRPVARFVAECLICWKRGLI